MVLTFKMYNLQKPNTQVRLFQVFKHAKRLGYGEHDVSAVYIRARFWIFVTENPQMTWASLKQMLSKI